MTKLVTFLYFGLEIFRSLDIKFRRDGIDMSHSLVQLSEMNLRISCYTGSNTAEPLQEFLDENGVTNVTD